MEGVRVQCPTRVTSRLIVLALPSFRPKARSPVIAGRPRAVDAAVVVAAVASAAHGRAVAVVERHVVILVAVQAQRRVVRAELHVEMSDAHRRPPPVHGEQPRPGHGVARDLAAAVRAGAPQHPAAQPTAAVRQAREAHAAQVRDEAGRRVVGHVHAVRVRLVQHGPPVADHDDPRTVGRVAHRPRDGGGARERGRRLRARLSFRRPPARASVDRSSSSSRAAPSRGCALRAVGPSRAALIRRRQGGSHRTPERLCGDERQKDVVNIVITLGIHLNESSNSHTRMCRDVQM